MRKYAVEFLKRGMAFGGFGPIIAGFVFFILEFTVPEFSLSGIEAFIAIISTYLLAFVQAGATVFNQIEDWPVAKSLACHFTSIYLAYVLCYLVNGWIPFDMMFVLVFTGIFVVCYFVIWLSVYLSIKAVAKRMNKSLT